MAGMGRGEVSGRGTCMAGCVCGKGACMAEGMCGGGMHGGGHVWQERWPLQWTVRILLECILVMSLFAEANKHPKKSI